MSKIIIKASGRKAEVQLYGDIGHSYDDDISASEFAEVIQKLKPFDELTVAINSGGGDAFDGIAIYNLLCGLSAKVITRNDALAASAASVILMAGDVIQAANNSIIMIHKAWSVAMGNADEMRHKASVLDKVDDQLIRAYIERTGLSRQKIASMLVAETWMDANEAKSLGFVDTVLGSSGAFARIDRNRFRNAPSWVDGSGTSTAEGRLRIAEVRRNAERAKEELWRGDAAASGAVSSTPILDEYKRRIAEQERDLIARGVITNEDLERAAAARRLNEEARRRLAAHS